jgi:hypothetical protein
MAFRDDLLALNARHDALAHEVAHKTRELDESRRMLEQAKAHAKLPVLDHLKIASPCHADWSQMTGDERTRHCGECKKNVYNLSGMTRDEAEALLIERNGDLCVRYYQRHDGTILLADCTVGARKRSKNRRIAVSAAALLAGGFAAASALSNRTVMGQMKTDDEPCHIKLGKYDGLPPGTVLDGGHVVPQRPEPPVPVMGAIAPTPPPVVMMGAPRPPEIRQPPKHPPKHAPEPPPIPMMGKPSMPR